MLLPTSNTVSLEGLPCDPGLLGVPGFDVFAHSFLESMSPSRPSECLNCDSDNRLGAKQIKRLRDFLWIANVCFHARSIGRWTKLFFRSRRRNETRPFVGWLLETVEIERNRKAGVSKAHLQQPIFRTDDECVYIAVQRIRSVRGKSRLEKRCVRVSTLYAFRTARRTAVAITASRYVQDRILVIYFALPSKIIGIDYIVLKLL